jgi:hypothetical protein
MVLQERIELSTSPLPRECSTTELLQRRWWRVIRRNRNGAQGGWSGNPALSGPTRALGVEAIPMRSPSDPPLSEKSRTLKRPASREDRLKAALKANMARRKAQAKARNAEDGPGDDMDETERD